MPPSRPTVCSGNRRAVRSGADRVGDRGRGEEAARRGLPDRHGDGIADPDDRLGRQSPVAELGVKTAEAPVLERLDRRAVDIDHEVSLALFRARLLRRDVVGARPGIRQRRASRHSGERRPANRQEQSLLTRHSHLLPRFALPLTAELVLGYRRPQGPTIRVNLIWSTDFHYSPVALREGIPSPE